MPSGSSTCAPSEALAESRPGSHHAGEVLGGKYRLVSLLGEGGMGEVWRAHSLILDIDVAIKLVRPSVELVELGDRLHREAQAAARLAHPGIVRIYDFGRTASDEPFLVMELLAGRSFANWVDESGPLRPGLAVALTLPVAAALARAHAAGMVHRDVKSENIIVVEGVASTWQPKLLDFGLVKLRTARSLAITQPGAVLGSPDYMSPEQVHALPNVDLRADVWALCVVLYELLTGSRPFMGPSVGDVLLGILRREPVPTVDLGAGDAELWAILARGLRKQPAERWPDMHALGRALAEWAVARGMTMDSTGASIAHAWLEGPPVFEVVPSDRPPQPAVDVVLAPTQDRSIHEGLEATLLSARESARRPGRKWIAAGLLMAAAAAGLGLLGMAAPAASGEHRSADSVAGTRVPEAPRSPQASPVSASSDVVDAKPASSARPEEATKSSRPARVSGPAPRVRPHDREAAVDRPTSPASAGKALRAPPAPVVPAREAMPIPAQPNF